MRVRWCASVVVALMSWVPVVAMGQTAAPENWTAPRTAFGQPDLSGTWANNRAPPMQRPEQFGDKASLTDEELAELTSQLAAFRDSEQAGDLLGDRLIQQALGNSEFQDFAHHRAGQWAPTVTERGREHASPGARRVARRTVRRPREPRSG